MSYTKISYPYINAPEDELPDEGVNVVVTDGTSYAVAYFLWSGSYEFMVDEEYRDGYGGSSSSLWFNPTHWMYVEYLNEKVE